MSLRIILEYFNLFCARQGHDSSLGLICKIFCPDHGRLDFQPAFFRTFVFLRHRLQTFIIPILFDIFTQFLCENVRPAFIYALLWKISETYDADIPVFATEEKLS